MSGRAWLLIAILLLGAAVGAAALLDHPGGVVDWRAARVVVFESDDWGLCGFVPAPDAVGSDELRRLGEASLPPAYWTSTLEDSATVAALASTLAAHRGRDGLPPVLQANMIVSALTPPDDASRAGDPSAWRRTDIPALPDLYARPGLWHAVAGAVAAGVWRPEFHGAYHYDPDRRRAAAAGDPLALDAARRGVLLFPGSGRAWELGAWRPLPALTAELDRSLLVFEQLFGRRPVSVAAPDYVWSERCEALWESRGLTIVQAKREQREQFSRAGELGERVLKVVARGWDRFAHPGRVFLERNCRFEPSQQPDAPVVERCLAEIARAWRRGEPAVVETHRVNFVNLAPGAAARGRERFAALLDSLSALPGGAPLYLTDEELAQLLRTGVSASRRGNLTILRNLTRSTRLVGIPGRPAWMPVGPGRSVIATPATDPLL